MIWKSHVFFYYFWKYVKQRFPFNHKSKVSVQTFSRGCRKLTQALPRPIYVHTDWCICIYIYILYKYIYYIYIFIYLSRWHWKYLFSETIFNGLIGAGGGWGLLLGEFLGCVKTGGKNFTVMQIIQ